MDIQNGTGKLLAGIMRFTCAEHLPAGRAGFTAGNVVLERDEWEARG